MTNKINDKQFFVDCEDIDENTASYSFNTNILKIGKVKISLREIDKISFLIAHVLKTFTDTGGKTSTLSANALYTHFQSN